MHFWTFLIYPIYRLLCLLYLSTETHFKRHCIFIIAHFSILADYLHWDYHSHTERYRKGHQFLSKFRSQHAYGRAFANGKSNKEL